MKCPCGFHVERLKIFQNHENLFVPTAKNRPKLICGQLIFYGKVYIKHHQLK